jgi:CelD/BcsL family acetyltransferase involved in cellulose biosynthesis
MAQDDTSDARPARTIAAAVADAPPCGPDVATPPLQFEAVTDPATLLALADEWDALCRRAECRYFSDTFVWHWQAWQCVGAPLGRRMFVVVGRDQGRAVLIWPLTLRRDLLWSVAHWLGSETTEYRDVIVEAGAHDRAWLDAALDFLRSRPGIDALDLGYVRDDACVAPLLQQAGARSLNRGYAYAIDATLWRDWDAAYARLSRKFRADERRVRRNLARFGKVAMHRAQSPPQVATALQWLAQQKTDWFARKELSGGRLASAAHWRFLTAVAQEALRREALRLATLRVDDRVVAANLAFVGGNVVEFLVMSYDRAWHKGSPGRVLLIDSLRRAAEDGFAVVDLRTGSEPYKQRFAPQSTGVASYVLPCTFLGQLYCWAVSLALRLPRRWRQRVRCAVAGKG